MTHIPATSAGIAGRCSTTCMVHVCDDMYYRVGNIGSIATEPLDRLARSTAAAHTACLGVMYNVVY